MTQRRNVNGYMEFSADYQKIQDSLFLLNRANEIANACEEELSEQHWQQAAKEFGIE